MSQPIQKSTATMELFMVLLLSFDQAYKAYARLSPYQRFYDCMPEGDGRILSRLEIVEPA